MSASTPILKPRINNLLFQLHHVPTSYGVLLSHFWIPKKDNYALSNL